MKKILFVLNFTACIFGNVVFAADPVLTLTYRVGGDARPLKAWTYPEFEKLSEIQGYQIKDENLWQGVKITTLMEKSLDQLSPEQKAQVDLVVLKGSQGRESLIPRAFLVKYPMMIAITKNKKRLTQVGPFYSVVPWNNNEIRMELLPVVSFYVPQVKEIELGNFQDRFGAYFLKRRSDPAAMRGEKVFIQTCMSCHATQPDRIFSQMEQKKASIPEKHKAVRGFKTIGDKGLQALEAYIVVSRAERK